MNNQRVYWETVKHHYEDFSANFTIKGKQLIIKALLEGKKVHEKLG